MKIIKKEKDREVSFLIEEIRHPVLYKMIFNPDYFESLGLKQVYGATGGGDDEKEYPYKYFHILYDWMFSSKPQTSIPNPVPDIDRFQYPKSRMILEALMESVKPPKIEMHPYDLRKEPPPDPVSAAVEKKTQLQQPKPEQPRYPETMMEDLTESHPYDFLPEEKETVTESNSFETDNDLVESNSPETSPVDNTQETNLEKSSLVFTFHKIGLVHGYKEYCETKRRNTTVKDIEEDANGKTKQEVLKELQDAEVQAYYKEPLLKMTEKPEVQEAKADEAAFLEEKVFIIRNSQGELIMLDWRLFPGEESTFYEKVIK